METQQHFNQRAAYVGSSEQLRVLTDEEVALYNIGDAPVFKLRYITKDSGYRPGDPF